MTEKELKDKLIDEAQTNWAKVDIYRRVCGSEFSYYDGFIDCGVLKEKHITELEQEKCELLGIIQGKDKLIQELEKENAELEEENARLKEKLKPENCLKLLAKDGYIKFTSEQLTKAKEIIKKYYTYNPSCEYFYEDIDKEAEQFLEEIKENE